VNKNVTDLLKKKIYNNAEVNTKLTVLRPVTVFLMISCYDNQGTYEQKELRYWSGGDVYGLITISYYRISINTAHENINRRDLQSYQQYNNDMHKYCKQLFFPFATIAVKEIHCEYMIDYHINQILCDSVWRVTGLLGRIVTAKDRFDYDGLWKCHKAYIHKNKK